MRRPAWFVPPAKAGQKGVETKKEPAFVIGLLGEARCLDDERQVASFELSQGGRRSGIASSAELGGADLGHGVADTKMLRTLIMSSALGSVKPASLST